MKKLRELKVASVEEALKRMQAYLYANMIDNELETDDEDSEDPNYYVKLVWLYRDFEGEKKVGCPCFACDFKGIMPFGNNQVHGIVYVKIFADKDYNMIKMHLIELEPNFDVLEIQEGETFRMHDEEGRYEDEIYLFKDDVITKVG